MRVFRPLKWVAAILGVALLLASSAASYVYFATEPLIRRTYDAPLRDLVVPSDPVSIAEGRRLALVRGCYDGCHGPAVSGYQFEVDAWIGKAVAPELTQVFATHTDAELERVIRRGVRKNGKSTWFMPSNMFYHLSDEDLGKIIAFIRSLPPGKGRSTEMIIGPLWRFELLHDRYLPMVEEIARDAPWMTDADRQGQHGLGRYLATTACTECHGMDLAGASDGSAPNLAVVASYPEAAFGRLMKTGVAIGDRELGLMAEVARTRFSQLTDVEIHALYAYLQARAASVAVP